MNELPETALPDLIVDMQSMPSKGILLHGELNMEQRASLASNHDLQEVQHFTYDLIAKPWRRDGFRLAGTISAKLTQTCIATLEPVAATIDETIDQTFQPEPDSYRRQERDANEIEFEIDPDEPEYFLGQSVNVAAIVEEYFALALPLYPRSPNAELIAVDTDKAEKDKKPDVELSPLAAQLLKFKQKQ